MEKISKKLLALTVSAALCVTAFVGCLTVKAETVSSTASITVEDATIAPGETGTVKVTLSDATKEICASLMSVTFPEGFEITNATADNDRFKFVDENGGNMYVAPDKKNVLKFAEFLNWPDEFTTTSVVFTLTVKAPTTTGDYNVTVEHDSSNYNEQTLTLTVTNGKVTVGPVLDSETYFSASEVSLGVEAGFFLKYYFVFDSNKYDDFKLVFSRKAFTLENGSYVLKDLPDSVITKTSDAQSVELVGPYGDEYDVNAFYRGVPMYEMAVKVTASLYFYKNGVEVAYSTPVTLSVADAIKTAYSGQGAKEKFKKMAADALVLGDAAQKYFGKLKYDFSTLESPIKDFDTSFATVTPAEVESVLSTDDYMTSSLLIASAPGFSFEVMYNGDYTYSKEDLSFDISYTNSQTNSIEKLNVSATDDAVYSEEDGTEWGYFTVSFDLVAMYDLDKTVTAKFVYKAGTDDEQVLCELSQSVQSVVAAALDVSGIGESSQTLYKSVLCFGETSNGYFNVQ